MRANRERSRVIGALARHTAHRFAQWLRVLGRSGIRLAHGLVLEWRCRCDVRALQRLDDRALADISAWGAAKSNARADGGGLGRTIGARVAAL